MLLPLTGVLDGLGTELGGGALLIAIGKIILDIIREKKSKKIAVAAADNSEKANEKNNPAEMTLSRKRMNGKTSMDYVLLVLDQHTDQLKEMVTAKSCDRHQEETKDNSTKLDALSISVSRIQGQLSQLLKGGT